MKSASFPMLLDDMRDRLNIAGYITKFAVEGEVREFFNGLPENADDDAIHKHWLKPSSFGAAWVDILPRRGIDQDEHQRLGTVLSIRKHSMAHSRLKNTATIFNELRLNWKPYDTMTAIVNYWQVSEELLLEVIRLSKIQGEQNPAQTIADMRRISIIALRRGSHTWKLLNLLDHTAPYNIMQAFASLILNAYTGERAVELYTILMLATRAKFQPEVAIERKAVVRQDRAWAIPYHPYFVTGNIGHGEDKVTETIACSTEKEAAEVLDTLVGRGYTHVEAKKYEDFKPYRREVSRIWFMYGADSTNNEYEFLRWLYLNNEELKLVFMRVKKSPEGTRSIHLHAPLLVHGKRILNVAHQLQVVTRGEVIFNKTTVDGRNELALEVHRQPHQEYGEAFTLAASHLAEYLGKVLYGGALRVVVVY